MSSLFGVEGIVNGVGGLVKSILGDKAAREDNVHSEQMSAEQAMAADAAAQQRDNRTKWDSFVDGLNRLPRPIIAFMVIGAIIWAPINPIKFNIVMQSYAIVPMWLAAIFGQVILLFFGGRMLDGWNMKATDPATVEATINHIKTLQEMAKKPLEAPPVANFTPATTLPATLEKVVPASSNELAKELIGSKPMSLPAIVAYNQKMGWH